MVLGDVVGEETGAIERLDDLQPLFVIVGERQVVAIEVVEDAEFEAHSCHSICALIALRVFVDPAVRLGLFDHR